jgi:hypothetical protein
MPLPEANCEEASYDDRFTNLVRDEPSEARM